MTDLRFIAICLGGCMIALFAAVWAIDRLNESVQAFHRDYRETQRARAVAGRSEQGGRHPIDIAMGIPESIDPALRP